MRPNSNPSCARHWQSGIALATLLALPLAVGGAQIAQGNVIDLSQDPIVGTWVGQAAQPNQDPFEVRLTFVSPKGGVSRYPGDPACGGILRGDRSGDHYEYQERITYGGTEELDDGCLEGNINLTVKGDTMKFDWTASANGQDFSSSGELHRQGGARKR